MPLILLLIGLLISVGADAGDNEYIFYLHNGKRLIGQVVQESEDTIEIETPDGRVTLLRKEVDRRAPYLVNRDGIKAAEEAVIGRRYLEAIASFRQAYRDVQDSDLRQELQRRIAEVVEQWVRQSERRSGADVDWSDADRLVEVEGFVDSSAALERLKAEVRRIRDVRAQYLVAEAKRLVEDEKYDQAEQLYYDLRDHGYSHPQELADTYVKHAVQLMGPPDRDYDRALRLLLRAREVDPELFIAHLYLAQAYLELDDAENAEKELRESTRYVAKFSAVEKQVFDRLVARLARASRFPTFAPIPTVSPEEIARTKEKKEQESRQIGNRLTSFYARAKNFLFSLPSRFLSLFKADTWKGTIVAYWYVALGVLAAFFVLWYLPWRYVQRDFSGRTLTGPNWSTVAFFTGIVGLLMYLLVRLAQEGRKVRCKRCGYNLSRAGDYSDYDYTHCPGCKAPIRPVFHLDQLIVSRARLLLTEDASSAVDKGSEEELFHLLCLHGFRSRADRMDLQSDGKDLRTTLLIDGVRHPAFVLPPASIKLLLPCVRKKGNVDSSAPFPQTGYFMTSLDDSDVEIRVTIRTGDLGESLQLRMVDRRTGVLDLARIGLDEEQQGIIRQELEQPSGLIAVAGPPGSGRTTLAYAMLRHLNDGQHYLTTLEDGVHADLPGVTQVDQRRSGMKGRAAVEAIVRQNADVVFVEEVSDRESLELLLGGSSTNRRAIICLESPDTLRALERLLSNNLKPELTAAGLSMLVGIRLVRKLCLTCKTEAKMRSRDLAQLGVPADQAASARLFARKGCGECARTGYRGRTGVFEILPVTEDLKEAIRSGRPREEILRLASSARLGSLMGQAGRKVLAGVVDVEEIGRVLGQSPGGSVSD